MIVLNQMLVSKYLVGDPGEKDGKGNLELSNKKLSWLWCQRNNRNQDSLADLCEGNCDFCGDDATRAAYEERRLDRQGDAVGPNIV